MSDNERKRTGQVDPSPDSATWQDRWGHVTAIYLHVAGGLILSYMKIKGRGVDGEEGAVSSYVKNRGTGMNDREVGRRENDD